MFDINCECWISIIVLKLIPNQGDCWGKVRNKRTLKVNLIKAAKSLDAHWWASNLEQISPNLIFEES